MFMHYCDEDFALERKPHLRQKRCEMPNLCLFVFLFVCLYLCLFVCNEDLLVHLWYKGTMYQQTEPIDCTREKSFFFFLIYKKNLKTRPYDKPYKATAANTRYRWNWAFPVQGLGFKGSGFTV
jgi:hypothetical protein